MSRPFPSVEGSFPAKDRTSAPAEVVDRAEGFVPSSLEPDNQLDVTVYVRDAIERLDAIPWKDVLIDHGEHERGYRIGKVGLLDLPASGSFRERRAFVAVL